MNTKKTIIFRFWSRSLGFSLVLDSMEQSLLLNVNSIPANEIIFTNINTNDPGESFHDLISIIIEEEAKLTRLSAQNKELIPDHPKKTHCILSTDKEALDFLSNGIKVAPNKNRMSFLEFLAQKRVKNSINPILNQSAQLLVYLKNNFQCEEKKSYSLLLLVSRDQPTLFNEYFAVLQQQGFKPSTILTRINSAILLIDYIRMVTDSDFRNLTDLIERLGRERTFYHTITSRANQQKTREKLIQLREWGEDGIVGLQRLMIQGWTYYDALIRLSLHEKLTCHQYSWSLGYTLASLWIFAVNARAQSIERMTMKDWKEMKTNQFHLANEFKTSKTYQYQIVASTDILKLFVSYLRPQIIPPEIDSDESILFPNSKGQQLATGELTRKIQNIFTPYGYHITVTRLRDMASTHIEDLFSSGRITLEEYKTFVVCGQTHSLSTHKTYYDKNEKKRKRKYEEGSEIQETFQKIFEPIKSFDAENESNSPSAAIPLSESPSQEEPPQRLPSFQVQQEIYSTLSLAIPKETSQRMFDEADFGVARNDLEKPGKRFEWLTQEIDQLEHYICNVEPLLPASQRKNRHSACLNYLLKAPRDVKQWFHPFHVESSGRLKTGYETALAKLSN
jgi:hypothetical protein